MAFYRLSKGLNHRLLRSLRSGGAFNKLRKAVAYQLGQDNLLPCGCHSAGTLLNRLGRS